MVKKTIQSIKHYNHKRVEQFIFYKSNNVFIIPELHIMLWLGTLIEFTHPIPPYKHYKLEYFGYIYHPAPFLAGKIQ